MPENLSPTTLEPSIETNPKKNKKRTRLDLQPVSTRLASNLRRKAPLSNSSGRISASDFPKAGATFRRFALVYNRFAYIFEGKMAIPKCNMILMIQAWMDLETSRIYRVDMVD